MSFRRAVKKLLGIGEDYYATVPPDLTDEEMMGIGVALQVLMRDTAEPA